MDGLEWLKDKYISQDKLDKTRKLANLASELSITLPQLAICWCMNNSNVSTVILGASKTAQLKENLKALEASQKVTGDVMERIDELLGNKPLMPQF